MQGLRIAEVADDFCRLAVKEIEEGAQDMDRAIDCEWTVEILTYWRMRIR